MNCFDLPIEVKAKIARKESNLHHLPKRDGKVALGEVIRRCLSRISPDEPERGIAAAKVMECALREIVNQDRVKNSVTEFYGINYLLTSLTLAIRAYEDFGRVNELMFISMRIGCELSSNQNLIDAKLVSRLI